MEVGQACEVCHLCNYHCTCDRFRLSPNIEPECPQCIDDDKAFAGMEDLH